MGLKKTLKKVASYTPIGAVGSILGGVEAKPAAPAFTELEELKNKQQQRAKDFRAGQAGMLSEANTAARQAGTEELNRKRSELDKNLSGRGLLYGGARTAGNVGLESDLASGLAMKSAETSKALEQQGQNLEDQALNTGLLLRSSEQDAATQKFQQAMAERESRLKGISSIGNSLGLLGGAYLGRK